MEQIDENLKITSICLSELDLYNKEYKKVNEKIIKYNSIIFEIKNTILDVECNDSEYRSSITVIELENKANEYKVISAKYNLELYKKRINDYKQHNMDEKDCAIMVKDKINELSLIISDSKNILNNNKNTINNLYSYRHNIDSTIHDCFVKINKYENKLMIERENLEKYNFKLESIKKEIKNKYIEITNIIKEYPLDREYIIKILDYYKFNNLTIDEYDNNEITKKLIYIILDSIQNISEDDVLILKYIN